MAVSPYISSMRQQVGHDLLLLPSVAVLPINDQGQVLLVRQADYGHWATIGGLVEIDESPEQAAVREAREEAGVEIQVVRLLTALGGPEFRVTYPNGDECAYVSMVYEARVIDGVPVHDGDETTAVGWFSSEEVATLAMGDLNRRLLTECLPQCGTKDA